MPQPKKISSLTAKGIDRSPHWLSPVSTHVFVQTERLDIPSPMWEHSQWSAAESDAYWYKSNSRSLISAVRWSHCPWMYFTERRYGWHTAYIATKALETEAEIHVPRWYLGGKKLHKRTFYHEIPLTFAVSSSLSKWSLKWDNVRMIRALVMKFIISFDW